jgi:serine/threonine protein kinase
MSDASILVALAGLCSAVYAVHQFVSSSHKLELIGCHHDLKPANVLVEGSTFVLADFGLSRFKDASESSATPSRTVHPYYTPPECCGPDDRSEKPIIHRSSDIWSLGCIVAEVVTYMLEGVKGLEELERQRAFEEGSFVRHRFHRGGAENPAVTAWIEKRQGSNSWTQQMLGQLVRQMLQLHHQDRPQARDVEAKMRFIATDAVCQPIQKVYQDICKEVDSIQPILERTRFDSWRYACGILNSNANDPLGQMYESAKYPLVHKTLGQIYDELKAVLVDCKNPRSRIYEPLRQLNDLLLDCLSDEGQDRARMYLDTQMMLEPSDTMALARIGEEEEDDDDVGLSQNRRLSIMASVVKCMTEVMEGRPAHIGSIDRRRLEKKAKVGDFKIQYLKSDGDESKIQVVVESKTYQEHYGDTRIATELQKRLEDITKLLRRANRAAEKDRFRVLRCAGFYQDPSAYSCGLIYEFPTIPSSKTQKVLTLRSALEETQQRPEDQPSLEQRFQLAQALASSILKFHTVSWLQKSISSFNVAFFHSNNESWLNGITNPFFLGFLYSRSNDKNAFTEGPTEDAYHRDYQHPDYSGKGIKNPTYRAEYDYYSLGLVLLEIGLWKSLSKILKRLEDASPSDGPSVSRLNGLLRSCVPRLKCSMGTRYQHIVETCLCGSFEVPSSLDERSRQLKLYRSFSSLVVEELAECKV